MVEDISKIIQQITKEVTKNWFSKYGDLFQISEKNSIKRVAQWTGEPEDIRIANKINLNLKEIFSHHFNELFGEK